MGKRRREIIKNHKFFVAKAYFDKGWGLTGYFKYIIALFGISSLNVKGTLLMGTIYGICCYFLGRIWFNWGYLEVENEIQNRFNPFQEQVREHLKNEKFK